jgi:predicted ferric reductase
MPVLVILAGYVVWIWRQPIDQRLKQHRTGPIIIGLGLLAILALWVEYKPDSISLPYLTGELAGVCSVYLMAVAMVLAARPRWLEIWFGGVDAIYLWHKRVAYVSFALLFPHWLVTGKGVPAITRADQLTPATQDAALLGQVSLLALIILVLVSIPRIGKIVRLSYERWLFLHRLTGLFLAMGLVHGLILDKVIAGSGILYASYLVIAVAGIVAYAYDELFMRARAPRADYTVATVERPSSDIVDVRLSARGEGIKVTPGQFVFLHVRDGKGWHEHPFSVAGTSRDRSLRLTIRVAGRDTARLHADLTTGAPATVTGPYGAFDHTLGGRHQIWIAGGVGISPFLSWLPTLDAADLVRVDLFYTVPFPSDAVYVPELQEAAARLPNLHVHPVCSRVDGRLTATGVAAAVGGLAPDTHVFLCGPPGLVEDLSRGLRRLGVPRSHTHTEHFAFR